jgi:hypothetical protein
MVNPSPDAILENADWTKATPDEDVAALVLSRDNFVKDLPPSIGPGVFAMVKDHLSKPVWERTRPRIKVADGGIAGYDQRSSSVWVGSVAREASFLHGYGHHLEQFLDRSSERYIKARREHSEAGLAPTERAKDGWEEWWAEGVRLYFTSVAWRVILNERFPRLYDLVEKMVISA